MRRKGPKKGIKPKISLITLGVSNLERSIVFYRDGLGLPMKEGSEGVAFFELQGTWLSLFPKAELAKDATVKNDGKGFPGFSLAHNVLSKEKVDDVMEFVKKAGAREVKKPQDTFWGGYSGYFADPDGYLWEVCWNPLMDLT